MNFYLRQSWFDPQLQFNSSFPAKYLGGQSTLEKIWVPDTFIPTGTKSTHDQATVPNTFVKLSNSGQVFISQRFSSVIQCKRNGVYPFDDQICSLIIESCKLFYFALLFKRKFKLNYLHQMVTQRKIFSINLMKVCQLAMIALLEHSV